MPVRQGYPWGGGRGGTGHPLWRPDTHRLGGGGGEAGVVVSLAGAGDEVARGGENEDPRRGGAARYGPPGPLHQLPEVVGR